MQNLMKILILFALVACSDVEKKPTTETPAEKAGQSQSLNDDKVNVQNPMDKNMNSANEAIVSSSSSEELKQACLEQLGNLPAPFTNEHTFKYCNEMLHDVSCNSTLGKPIFHFDKGSAKERHIKVLVFGTIHGDEGAAGSLARDWVHRLKDLEPRSEWRILPILNPDGLEKRTRTNANGVDLNRNFPTNDWFDSAQKFWRKKGARARRFPGNAGGSEKETQCIIKHIEDFKPDFIISIHTPYGVLDFDGPNVVKPASILPWRRLGHMPGSLGRYMWKDNEVPVLTIELKGGEPLVQKQMEDLQDIIGTVAIRSLKSLGRW